MNEYIWRTNGMIKAVIDNYTQTLHFMWLWVSKLFYKYDCMNMQLDTNFVYVYRSQVIPSMYIFREIF